MIEKMLTAWAVELPAEETTDDASPKVCQTAAVYMPTVARFLFGFSGVLLRQRDKLFRKHDGVCDPARG